MIQTMAIAKLTIIIVLTIAPGLALVFLALIIRLIKKREKQKALYTQWLLESEKTKGLTIIYFCKN